MGVLGCSPCTAFGPPSVAAGIWLCAGRGHGSPSVPALEPCSVAMLIEIEMRSAPPVFVGRVGCLGVFGPFCPLVLSGYCIWPLAMATERLARDLAATCRLTGVRSRRGGCIHATSRFVCEATGGAIITDRALRRVMMCSSREPRLSDSSVILGLCSHHQHSQKHGDGKRHHSTCLSHHRHHQKPSSA